MSDLAYVLVLGLGLGLGSAYVALDGRYPFEAVHIGPWTAWPKVGSRLVDPYARAMLARGAHLPMGTGEGLALVAGSDDAGRPLDASCRYAVSGRLPPSRGWTLNRITANEPGEGDLRAGFADGEVLREENGTMTIILSSAVAGGNWLPLPEKGHFTLVLRLYDTPISSTAQNLDRKLLPAITRLECSVP